MDLRTACEIDVVLHLKQHAKAYFVKAMSLGGLMIVYFQERDQNRHFPATHKTPVRLSL